MCTVMTLSISLPLLLSSSGDTNSTVGMELGFSKLHGAANISTDVATQALSEVDVFLDVLVFAARGVDYRGSDAVVQGLLNERRQDELLWLVDESEPPLTTMICDTRTSVVEEAATNLGYVFIVLAVMCISVYSFAKVSTGRPTFYTTI